jgi:hypothetical protein
MQPDPPSGGVVFVQPGTTMKRPLVGILADPEELDTFTSSVAHDIGCSKISVLEAFAKTLARQQRMRSDDLGEVLSLGRVRQTVAAALDALRDTSP